VKDLTSPDLVCNVNGGTAVSNFVSATAGDTLTFEWYHDTRGDDIIDSSHQGPIITYIAPFTTTNGASPVWTKIAEEGYDGASWAVAKLIANKGKKDFTLPSTLAPGKYLIRQEIIALHEADTTFNVNSARGAQFYPSCVQVDVTGSGSAVPDQKFDFNTGYSYTDAGIHFNLYAAYTSYPIPGPEVWSGEASSAVSSTPVVLASSSAVAATTATSSPAGSITSASSTPVTSISVAPSSASSSILASPANTATQTTFATLRRPTTAQTQPVPTTTTKPAVTASQVASCGPRTRTVTVFGRPDHF
jgi:cellulase